MEKEKNEQALTALQKVFGAVNATTVVAFLTGLIAKAVLESQKLADQIEAAIGKRLNALPTPVAPEMTEDEQREATKQHIEEIVRTTLAGQQEIIDEAVAKATKASSDGTTTAISQQLTAALANPVQLLQLATDLANNEKACSTLQKAIYFASLTARDEAKDRRMNNIAEAVILVCRERGKGELTVEEIEQLIYRIENEGVVRGKQARQYVEIIGEWLTDQEEKMTEAVAGVVQTRTNKATVGVYGRLLVLEGLAPSDTDGIRERLGKETDIKLRK